MVKAQSRVRGNYASFSSYVQELIRKDLETRNGMPVALAPQPSEVLP